VNGIVFGEGCNGKESQTRSVILPFCMTTPLSLPFSLTFLSFLTICLSVSLPYLWPIFYFCSFSISALPARHEVIVMISFPLHSEGLMQLNKLQVERKKGHLEKFLDNSIKEKQISSQHYSILHQHSGKDYLN